MVKPISPSRVVHAKKVQMPDFVIEAFNELIAKHFKHNSSHILQEDVVKAIRAKNPSIERDQEIFDNHWLDVEDIYRKSGWKVTYDFPVGYAGENFKAYYEFRKQ